MAERSAAAPDGYPALLGEIADLLVSARRNAARSVDSILTETYWHVGKRIVEFEQRGARRANYGEVVLRRLATDLSGRLGRGFGRENLRLMRRFYLAFRPEISQTASGKSAEATKRIANPTFPLSWSAYVRLLSLRNENARAFYEREALRCGWTIRQLDRQVDSQFYERTLLSKKKASMLERRSAPRPTDAATPEEHIKDPFILEFLGLKDEYSEADFEEALVHQLESFLLELGGDFAFVARQRRLRIGNAWYRVDLVFFHRTLRCLVIVDLKLGSFTHADAGQMHLYLNYAREHWVLPHENPPVGLILCSSKDQTLASELERTRSRIATRLPGRKP